MEIINENDINMVMEQANVNRITAINSLIRHNYDPIDSIVSIISSNPPYNSRIRISKNWFNRSPLKDITKIYKNI